MIDHQIVIQGHAVVIEFVSFLIFKKNKVKKHTT